MTTDGGLRQLFRKHIPHAHWQAIETGGTGLGIPDMNYCLEGCDGWIEAKSAEAWALKHPLSPEQCGWLERRLRAGGRAMLAVRKSYDGGVRRGPAGDELFIFNDQAAFRVIASTNSIRDAKAIYHDVGGPARWNWDAVRALMKETPK